MKKVLLLPLLLVIATCNLLGQQKANSHQLKILAETPVMYGLGYEYSISKRFSSIIQSGVLIEPNSSAILFVMNELGTDEIVIDLLENTFKLGLVIEAGVNYSWNNYYAGIFGQFIGLKANETPTNILEVVIYTELENYSNRNGTLSNSFQNENSITLKSSLFQAGFLFGRRINLNNKLDLDIEIAFSKNWYSKSALNSSRRDFSSASVELDTYLKEIYKDYAYVPSINFSIAYKI